MVRERPGIVLIVPGLSLKNLEPRVWDPASPYHLPGLQAVMASYADFHKMPARRRKAMGVGLRAYLDVPEGIAVYLDNGAFYFGSQPGSAPLDEYEEFVDKAQPDWKPIPQDYIPIPSMTPQRQRGCFDKSMRINERYQHNGYVPVVRIGNHLLQYTARIHADESLSQKPWIALGAIVPNLLRKHKAMPYTDILRGLRHVRRTFAEKSIHVFGVGGTATLHLTALIGFDSVDSSGWRNRAARGIVQLPGSGERLLADLGKWRGREPSEEEWATLRRCKCPACRKHGVEGLQASKPHGFCCRATHNLWVLHTENDWLTRHVANGTYRQYYRQRLDNSVYRPLIDELLALDAAEGPRVGGARKIGNRAAGAEPTARSKGETLPA
jgi:7-cyano-7-deazaguanine tRNA-ribosyltransferase